MSPFWVLDWLLMLGKKEVVVPSKAIVSEGTERRVIMIHTEALALQAKLHAEVQDLLVKAAQVGAIVTQAINEGRSVLSEDEAKLVTLFDSKTVLIEKVKQFLLGL